MIDELDTLLEKFSGVESRTRCFAHIVNLIAQTVIRQFDVPKAKDGVLVDEAMKELRVLATDIDIEELLTRANAAGKDADTEDDLDGSVNEQTGLSALDLKRLEANVQPVRRTLVKVSSHHPHLVDVLLMFAPL